jgi:uncharacterized protein DUF1707/2TM domain-containing protein
MCHSRHHHLRRSTTATPPDPGLRISDTDREQAITRFGEQAAEGRLTAEELDQRTGAALAARIHGELDPLFADLPVTSRPPGRGADRERDGRRAHLVAFMLVNLLLLAIWAAAGAGYFWPIWPLLGWGIGVLSHVSDARRTAYGHGSRHAQ